MSLSQSLKTEIPLDGFFGNTQIEEESVRIDSYDTLVVHAQLCVLDHACVDTIDMDAPKRTRVTDNAEQC